MHERPDDPRLRLEAVVRSVGGLARSLHGRVAVQYKGDGTPVTEADYALQSALVAGLQEAFPDDGVVSEEGERRDPRGEGAGTWYVDPIDGTGAFLQGLAHWGPCVSRVDATGRVDVGAFYEPMLDRVFSAVRGGGAWCDDRRLPIAATSPVRRDDVLYVPSRIHRRPGLPWPGKLRALGSTAAHLALLAAGGGRAAIIARWSMWDVGCGLLMNEEVGHVIRHPDGTPFAPAVSSEGLPFLVGAPTALDILDTGGWASGAMPAHGT
jgi:myo-inositol-1(or 4)-monophosphatase